MVSKVGCCFINAISLWCLFNKNLNRTIGCRWWVLIGLFRRRCPYSMNSCIWTEFTPWWQSFGPTIYLHTLHQRFTHSWIPYSHSVHSSVWDVSEIHLSCWDYQQFISFYSHVIVHCMDISRLVPSFIWSQTFGYFFPVWGYYEWSYSKPSQVSTWTYVFTFRGKISRTPVSQR